MTLQLQLDLVLLAVVVIAAVTDLAVRKIPNKLLMAGWAALLGLHLTNTAAGGLPNALLGALVGFALFMPLYAVRGMAAGDVKLMATVGLFLGPSETITACVLTWCVGGVMALLIIVFTGRWAAAYANLRDMLLPILLRMGPMPDSPQSRRSVGSMPYGVAIALTTLWLLAQRNHVYM
ncbi:hypothetical protein G4G28_23935 [Massilia sp. Dwa41.01b]|uniref:A24 family peptidase n=1 Tax=unclassified Massilia TaxID=2609279 RepID=UPI001600897A|nr:MULTISPECIES: prepilin peptidase [unclassified Massilia]QNA90796.1 hypothetical protein G4G28_23935 [Massilia sp. Dwa41.01b]QNA98034.1 hypothetical protein G4G31_03030 [Massilia sp. Se16.2.3]